MYFWCFVLCVHVKPFSQHWLSWGRSSDQLWKTVKMQNILQHRTLRQDAHPAASGIRALCSLHFICPVVGSRHEHVCLLSFLWVSKVCPNLLDPLVSLMTGFFPHVIGVSHCVVLFILDCGGRHRKSPENRVVKTTQNCLGFSSTENTKSISGPEWSS